MVNSIIYKHEHFLPLDSMNFLEYSDLHFNYLLTVKAFELLMRQFCE